MLRPLLLWPVAAVLVCAIAAPAPARTAEPDPAAASEEQSMPDKIREKLSADGYKDITVMPTSYAVSATDKNGKPVILLIGPASSSALKQQEEGPSIARQPDAAGKDKFIEQ